MNTPVIEFQNVSKVYQRHFWTPKTPAVRSLSFKVETGCIYGFLGANGAGKTTSIKLLLGLQRPTSGAILLWGEGSANIRSRLGYLPERPFFHENLTADEFLNFHRSLFGNSLRPEAPSNEELLELVDLKGTEKKLLKEFSKGMLQRIGAAQALVNNPDLLIWDEPMSGLDPAGRRHMRNLMIHLSQQGKTIFFSSHILSDVEAICHRIAFMEKGVLTRESAVKDLLKDSSGGMEIIFSLPAPAQVELSALQARKTGEAYTSLAKNHGEAKEIIEKIWMAGGRINSVQPEHPTLEEALFGKDGRSF